MALLDTHAHLTDPLFAGDLPAVLGRAAARDVTRIICVSSSPEDAAAAHALAARHAPVVHAAAGLHPELVARLTDAEADAAVAAVGAQLRARARAYVAVGEIGLDHSPHVVAAGVGGEAAVRARQRRAFEALLALAQEHGLPVSVHSRGAGRRAVDMLLEAEGVRAVLHCFDGRAVYAERAVAAGSGCFFSVPPCVVRDAQMQRMVRRLPLERLLLETDSPALGAVAGGRNEPAELVRSLDMIAALKGVSVDECRRVIDESARRVFPLAFLGSDCDGTAGASPVYVNATGGSAAH